MEYISDSEHSDITVVAGDESYKTEEVDQIVPLTQAELNQLTQDLNFSKESARLLGSRLKEKYPLAPGTTFYWDRDREIELRQFFTFQDRLSLVYCNIAGLIKSMGLEGVSLWCNGYSDGLQNRNKRVMLLRSLSDKYPRGRYEPPYPPSYGLNSTSTVLLEECLWL